jgi:hypothetical protein
MSSAAQVLHRRLREMRSRASVQRWEMRQLGHAGGVWFRLARLLASARSAWAITEADAAALVAEGRRPEAVGLELQPPCRIFVLDEERLGRLTSPLPLALRSSPELLACRALALVPFAGAGDEAASPAAGASGRRAAGEPG